MLLRGVYRLSSPMFIALLAVASAASAADIDLTHPTPQVVNQAPQAMPEGEPLRNIQFDLWRNAIPYGTVVGKIEKGLFCGDAKPRSMDKTLEDIMKARVKRSFEEVATELRFIRKRGEDSLFDNDASKGVDFRLGVTMNALDYRICERDGAKGTAYGKFKWELYSLRQQRVAYSAEIESSIRVEEYLPTGQLSLRFGKAVVGNLLADPAFLSALRGAVTAPTPSLAQLSVAVGATLSGPVTKTGEALVQAVVTVESGVGSGSAFYIGRDGLLLTNHHVVADAKFVKVKLTGGRSLVGEVLRVDKVRDVALLRTEPPGFPVLSVRTDEVRIGEEVYGIGSPFGAVLSGSLARGVVSSRRTIESFSFLQSDLALNQGNSGGPLVDAMGQVVGIAQVRAGAGVGLFIPIADALEKLALKLQADAQGR